MIECGWCGRATPPDRCIACGHEDPARPWVQRGQAVPAILEHEGRPSLDKASVARRLAVARSALGGRPTVEELAEHLDVSPRTVRRWQQVAG